MAKSTGKYTKQIKHLTDYLSARRESILNIWRTKCSADEDLYNRMSFSREEFTDQIPTLLNILNQRLLEVEQEWDSVERASQHGWHRWQRGYVLKELLAELDKLYDTLAHEVDEYLALYPDTLAAVINAAHQHILQIVREIHLGSVNYYDELRQTSAAEQAQTLQLALERLNEVTKQRGEHLRQTSHDLRASFGALVGAANLLNLPSSKEEQTQYIDMLNRNLASIQHMLFQMTDYARIEAGQDDLDIKPFDAAELLRSIVEQAQSIAQIRNIVLLADGPPRLPVVSDQIKVQRIVYNLLTNALKYTERGWVSVSWALENETRWILSVQDSGPGLTSGPAGLLAEQLKPLNEPASTYRTDGPSAYPSKKTPPTKSAPSQPNAKNSAGEGIGLFIVKRLCEQLKAVMEIETSEENGTLIRVNLLINQEASDPEKA